MNINTGLASHTYKTVAAAFLAILLLTGFSLVSPALAQTEDCACQGSCCESSDMQCCSGGAMGCCQSPGQTQPTGTAFHHVTVNIVNEEILLQIEPLSPPQADCESCTGDQECPSGGEPANVQTTILEQDENHMVILLTYEVNGTTFEVTVIKSLLWSYNEITEEINKTASFVSTEIAIEDMSIQFYTLSYMVQHAEYNLTVYTSLAPLNSETYNSSFTIMNYAPTGKSEVTSLEFVEFNSTVTLSQKYTVLGKVAKEVGKVYEKSDNETLAQLVQGYYVIQEEAEHLAKLVKKQLPEYNKEILQSAAILMDQDIIGCLSSILSCLATLVTMPQILSACYLCAQVVTCLPACFSIFGFWWCIGCIAAGFIGCLVCASGIVGFPLSCYMAGVCLGLW